MYSFLKKGTKPQKKSFGSSDLLRKAYTFPGQALYKGLKKFS
jgi:hypothetical protein